MITASLSPNEAMRPRAEKILAAVQADERFSLGNPGDLPFDLRIRRETECPQCHGQPYPDEYCEQCGEVHGVGCGTCLGEGIIRKTMHVELKDFTGDDGSDYLSSILNGHLYEQILAARERHEPVAVVVLGDDSDVGAAIRKAASRETDGYCVDLDKFLAYHNIVEGFEANCIALGVPVWRLKTDPYGRMLLRVRKILEGGDLTGFAPSPAEGERQAVGLSILAGKGIGPAKAKAILEHFRIQLQAIHTDAFLVDCDGIGEKLALQIRKSMTVDGGVLRPKKQKAEGKK